MRVLVVLMLIFGPPSRAWGAVHMHRHPTPVGETGVAKRKGAGLGGGSPGLHKERSDAEGWGHPVPRRSFTLAHARGDPLGKGRQEEKARTVCMAHGALRRDVESGR